MSLTTYEVDDRGIALIQLDRPKSLNAIKASGKSTIHTLTADEKARWVKALMPVQDELAPRIGKELSSAIRKETGQAK